MKPTYTFGSEFSRRLFFDIPSASVINCRRFYLAFHCSYLYSIHRSPVRGPGTLVSLQYLTLFWVLGIEPLPLLFISSSSDNFSFDLIVLFVKGLEASIPFFLFSIRVLLTGVRCRQKRRFEGIIEGSNEIGSFRLGFGDAGLMKVDSPLLNSLSFFGLFFEVYNTFFTLVVVHHFLW